MSGAVAFVFGLCALSFAAGCVLTAYMLRREPEPTPEHPPAPPAVPPVELKLDLAWPPEDYATKPIHRNPVLGLPVTERPVEPARPALSLVPDFEPVDERAADERAADERAVVEPAPDEPAPDERVVEAPERRPLEVVPELVEEESATPDTVPAPGNEPERAPEPVVVAVPAQPEPVVVELPAPEPGTAVPAQAVSLPDAAEFRQRYLRTFEAARKRTST